MPEIQKVRVVVREPENIPGVDVAFKRIKGAQKLETGGNVYEAAGQCTICGKTVYRFVEGDPTSDAIGDDVAVFVSFSHREPPGLYCKAHDPNAGHRTATRAKPMLGDEWKPRA